MNNEDNNIKENDDKKDSEEKSKSKKQKKEEKKRKKYEQELISAAIPPEEIIEEKKLSKKEKKSKNITDEGNVDKNLGEDVLHEAPNKNKKRKRQDTVNDFNEEVTDVNGKTDSENKPNKKKQNIVTTEEAETKNEKFNWHATILTVLQKKGNEIPFKRLQKKVLSEYSETTGNVVDDRIAEKFIKKLKSAPNVKVDKNRVILQE